MGLSSERERSRASGPHGYQSTGLCACWSRYGLVSWINLFVWLCVVILILDSSFLLQSSLYCLDISSGQHRALKIEDQCPDFMRSIGLGERPLVVPHTPSESPSIPSKVEYDCHR